MKAVKKSCLFFTKPSVNFPSFVVQFKHSFL
jgi:hypothetical protein